MIQLCHFCLLTEKNQSNLPVENTCITDVYHGVRRTQTALLKIMDSLLRPTN
jgi:hypothetical protein